MEKDGVAYPTTAERRSTRPFDSGALVRSDNVSLYGH